MLVIKEMQIKITMRYHYTYLIKWGGLKNKIKNWLIECCLDCGETKIRSLLVEMQNGTAILKKSLAVSY